MKEQEWRNRLESLTKEIPEETHRAFLQAASPGKEEEKVKKRISAGLVLVILISVAALGMAAKAALRSYTVDWAGKEYSEEELPEEEINVPDPQADYFVQMRNALNAIPDGMAGIVFGEGEPPTLTRYRTRKVDDLTSWSHPGLILPETITDNPTLEVTLSLQCAADGEYRLVKEENMNGFTIKMYETDPAYDIVSGYTLSFKDENKRWHIIRMDLSMSQNTRFSFADASAATSESIDLPGWDKAIFIQPDEMNYSFLATRTLKEPVTVKRLPASPEDEEEICEYRYEQISIDGYPLKECLVFFPDEGS